MSLTVSGVGPNHAYPEPTDASIRAAAAAVFARGGGVVHLPVGHANGGGWAPIVLSSALPMLGGVRYQGCKPRTIPQYTTRPDGTPGNFEDGFEFSGGTVLEGDYTFRGFAGNDTDLAVPAPDVATSGIRSAAIVSVGLQKFTNGIKIGAENIMGLDDSGWLDDIHVRDCTDWGVWLTNFMMIQVGRIDTCFCKRGQRYSMRLKPVTMACGNSTFGRLFDTIKIADREHRGIMIDVGDNTGGQGILGGLMINSMQVNGFGNSGLTETVTLTSGSPSITVADGAQYKTGMNVSFSTTALGFTASRAYFVKSVTGNTIQLAASRFGPTNTAINATGSGTLSMLSYGYPNIEIYGEAPSPNGNLVSGIHISSIDSEGQTGAGLYLENVTSSRFHMDADPAQKPGAGVIARNAGGNKFTVGTACSIDLDVNSSSGYYFGSRTANYNSGVPGIGRDLARGATPYLTIVGGSSTDIEGRASFLYPTAGIGEKFEWRQGSSGTGGLNCGLIVLEPTSAPVTQTLPTIVGNAAAAPLSSNLGVRYEFLNLGTQVATINTAGGQLVNNIAARTSVVLAPGQGVRLTAVAGASNGLNLYWAAVAVSPVT